MPSPVLILHAPERRGKQIALSADLHIGDADMVTISALVGPETQAWVQKNGKKALQGLGVRLDCAKRLLGRYTKLEGDWSKFGSLGSLGFDVVRQAAGMIGPPGQE